MNRKQKIIISVTGIFIVLLILVGLTYAYFLTRIQGNTNSKSISVTTADLKLDYGEETNEILGVSNAQPGYSVEKVFTATNNGNSDVDYVITFEDVLNELTRQGDLVYSLECSTYLKEGFSYNRNNGELNVTGTKDGECNGVKEETFPNTTDLKMIVRNKIKETQVQIYKIKVTYLNKDIDQGIDMNKNYSAKINIKDYRIINPYKDTELAGTLINKAMNVTEKEEKEDGYAKFRVYPLTIPGKEVVYAQTKDYSEITSYPETNILLDANQSYYFTYASDYDVVDSQFQLINPKVVKYNENRNELKGKYVVSLSGVESSQGEDSVTSNSMIYKISDIEQDITESSFKYAKVEKIPGSKEKSLVSDIDDYGTTYYYRGLVTDNYVSFGDKLWRIVRINGDGSIKLVLNDAALESVFNEKVDDNAYVGYMYGLAGVTTDKERCLMLSNNEVVDDTTKTSKNDCENNGGTWTTTAYEATHANIKDSTIKNTLDNWYEENIKTNYDNYISDTLFCGDKEMSEIVSQNRDTLGYAEIKDYYSVADRLFISSLMTKNIDGNPTFECTSKSKYTNSRYSKEIQQLKNGNKTNGNLKYSIGLLTADEVVYTGNPAASINGSYLYNKNFYGWYTMTPAGFSENLQAHEVFIMNNARAITKISVNSERYVRPVINLKSNVEIQSGDGTINNPYTLK